MKYRLPTIDDYEILKEYVEEHYANGEKNISASLNMTNMDFKTWVEKVNRNSTQADDEWGKYYLYLVFNEKDKLIGLLNIRFNLPDFLREKYGDIGYGVRPSERKKGYASKMLKYALDICKKKEMKYAIVGCYENNIGSNKIILKNGGKLYRKDIDNIKINDYWNLKLKINCYKIEL